MALESYFRYDVKQEKEKYKEDIRGKKTSNNKNKEDITQFLKSGSDINWMNQPWFLSLFFTPNIYSR